MTTTRRRADHGEARAAGWAMGTFVVLLVGAALLVWVVVRATATDPVPWDKPAEVDGAVVRLSYLGSECRDGASVDVEEGTEQVVITIRETVYRRSCSDVGVSYGHEVRLDESLGERELVDGACLLAELARRSACR